MASFEIKVMLAELPEILNAMREWLDHNKTSITHFRSATDDAGMVSINVGFTQPDHNYEEFLLRFGPAGTRSGVRDGASATSNGGKY